MLASARTKVQADVAKNYLAAGFLAAFFAFTFLAMIVFQI
jgi:hypothetical protein